MSRVDRGEYDLPVCVQWYAKYKADRAAHYSELDKFRLRKISAEAELLELEVKDLQEKLLPVEGVKEA